MGVRQEGGGLSPGTCDHRGTYEDRSASQGGTGVVVCGWVEGWWWVAGWRGERDRQLDIFRVMLGYRPLARPTAACRGGTSAGQEGKGEGEGERRVSGATCAGLGAGLKGAQQTQADAAEEAK